MNEPSRFASARLRARPRSWKLKGPARRCPQMWLLLGVALSACTRSIVTIPDAPGCQAYVPDSLWSPTPGAPLPLDDSAGAWVAFANGQSAQLEIANLKPPAIRHIIETCEARHAAAIEKAQRQSRPWWRR